MSSLLEQERRTLEELDEVERAVVKRIRRNPDIYKPSGDADHDILGANRKPTNGLTLLQKHEVKMLIDRYKEQSERAKTLLTSLKDEQGSDFTIEKFSDLLKRSADEARATLDEKVKDWEIYEMFSCDPEYKATMATEKKPERHRILSQYTASLKLNQITSQPERFGKFLDLEPFYRTFLTVSSESETITYAQYLEKLTGFNGIDERTECLTYVHDLEAYLRKYWLKTEPLEPRERSLEQIENDLVTKKWKGVVTDEGIPCLVCQKKFAKETSYDSHLNGKKHKKAEKRRGELVHSEEVIRALLSQILSKEFRNTKNEVQRCSLLTVREKLIEQQDARDLSDDEMDYYHDERDAEKGEKWDYNPLKLPLGPDGQPIPYWLYKIRGLDMTNRCEVCGNVEYKGRDAFANHFKEPRHINGLKMLGVTNNFGVYKDLTKINEVLELMNNLERRQRNEVKFAEAGEEVEDDEGNAMSKSAYEQLKKQGLL